MTKVVTKLSDELIAKLKNADEIWIAVALLTENGLSFIQGHLLKSCKQNFLVGIDLPTDPKALRKLYSDQLMSNLAIKVYTEKECYHPKLYLIREKNKYIAVIGSANCTNGGLYNNIELNICIDNQDSCIEILNWFSSLFTKSNTLTKPFIDKYAKEYEARKNRKEEDEKIARKEKQILIQEFEATLFERNEFINVLSAYRNQPEYENIKNERNRIVEELREVINYPDFRTIDVNRFFSIQQCYSNPNLVSVFKFCY